MEGEYLFWAATDEDGRSYLYSRKPERCVSLGVWIQGRSITDGNRGAEKRDASVVRYYGEDAPTWEQEPIKVKMTLREHDLIYYEYCGMLSKARALRRLIQKNK